MRVLSADDPDDRRVQVSMRVPANAVVFVFAIESIRRAGFATFEAAEAALSAVAVAFIVGAVANAVRLSH